MHFQRASRSKLPPCTAGSFAGMRRPLEQRHSQVRQVARQGASGEARTGPHTASNRSNGHAPGRLRLRPRSYVQAYDGPESFGSTCIFILQLVTWEGTRVERHKDACRHMGLHKGSDGAVAACGHEGHGSVRSGYAAWQKQDRPGLTCKAVSQRLRRL